MIKVIVVDDEYYAREGMKKTIDWNQYGCILCGEAEDALEAIELAKRVQPDIIITDICMPGMDGLSMAKEVRESVPQSQFIIVTGHDEFDYAKRAFKIDAIDFLLKPIDQEEFIRAIKKSALICKKQKEEQRQVQKEEQRQNIKKQLSQVLTPQEEVLVSTTGEKVLISIKARDRLRMEKQLQVLYLEKLKEMNVELGVVKGISINIIIGAVDILKQSNIRLQNMGYKKSQIYIEVDQMNTIDELYQLVHSILLKGICSLKRTDIEVQGTGIEKAVEYMKENYNKEISLSDVAKHSFLSESYLSRKIKKVLGIGFSEYVTKLRMEAAMHCLQDSNLKVTEVAKQVGYTDYRYFSQAFKKYTGYSPREYGKVKV